MSPSTTKGGENMENKLRELRNRKNVTQQELATMLEVSQQLVAAWEVGRSTPRPKHMQMMENIFNTKKKKFFFTAP